MTVDDIAHEAGIGKGTMYLYFPSKEEVALSWFDRANQALQKHLREIAGSASAPADRLRKMLLVRVMTRFDNAQNFVESLDELFAAVRPSLLARRTRYHDAEAAIFSAVLEDGRRDGSFELSDVNAAAYALLLATNSLLPYSLSASQLGRRDEIEMKTSWIADLLLNGLLRRTAP
jgi:AcrR family transcriptional regulator